jgi:peptidoglycan/LPS O-acetylase OafA/YrhL
MTVMQYHFSGGQGGLGLGAGAAVACFFAISGFLSSLVLEQKYAGERARYWASRALRIYPPYFAALALALGYSLFVWLALGALTPAFARLLEFRPGPGESVLLVLSQLSLLGQELLGMQPLGKLLLLPQAWSLSVEILLYAAAPWMLRWNHWALAGLGLFSLAYGCGSPFAAHSAAPYQAGYFCLGILAWRHRERLWFPLALAHARPPLDRFMGDMSYLLYLTHTVSGDALAPFIQPGPFGWSRLWLWPLCFAVAMLLWLILDRPLQARRDELSTKILRSLGA